MNAHLAEDSTVADIARGNSAFGSAESRED
jgi:hypothetical protein